MKKHKVLFIMQLPPPVHGASMMNKYIKGSRGINEQFDTSYLPLNFVKNIQEIGKFSFSKIYKMSMFIFKLCYRLSSFKPALVYYTIAPFGFAFYRDSLFVFFIKLFRVKIVFHLHGKGIQQQCKNKLKACLYRVTFKNTVVINLSKGLNYDLKDIYKGKIYNIPNGIPDDFISSRVDEIESTNLLYLSNLVKSKGVLDLLYALEKLKGEDLNYHLNIVGNPADIGIDELKSTISDLGLNDKVEVLGPKYKKDKLIELQNGDIFIFPTYFKNECFPLSILEAIQNENVVISTDNGAIKEILEDCGVVVDKRDIEALSYEIRDLIKNKERIKTLQKKSRTKYLKKYTLDIFESNLVESLEEILAKDEP